MPTPKDPLLELQGAMTAVLRDNADMTALFAACDCQQWLFEDVPAGTRTPYVTMGEGQIVPDLADCIDGSEIYFDFHIWAPSWEQCKQIRGALWSVLSDATLTMTDNVLKLIEPDGIRDIRDPDGVTKHGVLTLRALTEPA